MESLFNFLTSGKFLALIIVIIGVNFLYKVWERKNRPQNTVEESGEKTDWSGIFEKIAAAFGNFIKGLFSIKIFRLPFILFALLLSLMVINYMDHSDTKTTGDETEKSYIPEKGFLGNLWEVLFGKSKTKDDQNTEQQTSGYNPQPSNPNVVVRQTEKTKRDSLYYDNLEKKWLHDEKMKKMEAEKEAENNKPIQMIPINSFQTPQHPDNGWGGQQNNNTGSSTNMTQLEGFQKPQ